MKAASIAIAVATLSCAATVGAQQIILYEDDNFNGQRYSANHSVNDLDSAGFNDRASSVIDPRRFVAAVLGCLLPRPVRHAGARRVPVARRDGTERPRVVAPGNRLEQWRRRQQDSGWGGGGGGGGGPASIVLFESPGMTGRSYTLNQATSDLGGTGFNDRATSAIVNSGTWQLCVDANYESSCEVFGPGQHAQLGGVGGRVSSARPFYGGGGGGGGGNSGGGGGGNIGGGGNWGGNTRVVLYEGQNFSGRSYTVTNDLLNNLGATGFNDRASSLRIERGYWMFCSDANFLGDCRTFGPGDYPTLSVAVNNRISSGRRDLQRLSVQRAAAMAELMRRARSRALPAAAMPIVDDIAGLRRILAQSRDDRRRRACRRTGTGRAISRPSTCRTTATGSFR